MRARNLYQALLFRLRRRNVCLLQSAFASVHLLKPTLYPAGNISQPSATNGPCIAAGASTSGRYGFLSFTLMEYLDDAQYSPQLYSGFRFLLLMWLFTLLVSKNGAVHHHCTVRSCSCEAWPNAHVIVQTMYIATSVRCIVLSMPVLQLTFTNLTAQFTCYVIVSLGSLMIALRVYVPFPSCVACSL